MEAKSKYILLSVALELHSLFVSCLQRKQIVRTIKLCYYSKYFRCQEGFIMEDNILMREDIKENVIAIKINQAYRENMT